jgi:hypothetical protein
MFLCLDIYKYTLGGYSKFSYFYLLLYYFLYDNIYRYIYGTTGKLNGIYSYCMNVFIFRYK